MHHPKTISTQETPQHKTPKTPKTPTRRHGLTPCTSRLAPWPQHGEHSSPHSTDTRPSNICKPNLANTLPSPMKQNAFTCYHPLSPAITRAHPSIPCSQASLPEDKRDDAISIEQEAFQSSSSRVGSQPASQPATLPCPESATSPASPTPS